MTEIILFAALGLAVGSFGNVLIHRFATGESFGGRSRCPFCRRNLRWYELFPVVSYVVLRGRCRTCEGKISFAYPLIELGTAMLFVLAVLLASGDPIVALLLALLLAFLLFASVYDIRHQQVPDAFTAVMAVLAVSISLIRGDIFSSVLGGAVVFLWFFAQWILGKGKLVGTGDLFLGTVLGFLLGFPGALFMLFLSYAVGAVVVLVLLSLRMMSLRQRRVPFIPFFAIATVMTLLGAGEMYTGLV